MDELYQVNVRLLWNHFPQTEPTMDMIRHASRTRSDSNSFTIDNSEFDRDVLGLLDNNQHALICFASLYEDFKYSSVCCVYEGWEISVWTSLATESKPCVFHRHHVAFWNLSSWTVLLNAIQTSSHSLNPQRRQAGVESSKEMQRKRRIERSMNRYSIEYPETQDLKEQYTMLETQLREIDSVADRDWVPIMTFSRLWRESEKDVEPLCMKWSVWCMTRNVATRSIDWTSWSYPLAISRFKETIDQLTIQLQDKVHACHYVVLCVEFNDSWKTTTILCSMTTQSTRW